MDAEEADPGESAHPTLFYGLWPRFGAEDEEPAPAAAESTAGGEL